MTEETSHPDETRREAGARVQDEMLGKAFFDANSQALSGGGEAAVAMGRFALEHVYGDVWGRPGLDRRSRSLVTLGILMAQGLQTQTRNHVVAGLANGLTPDEIFEAVLHTAPYIGYPLAGDAMATAIRAVGEVTEG